MYNYVLFVSVRAEEYIASGRDKFIVDPDPNQIYTKRKTRECSISLPGPSAQNNSSFNLLSIVSSSNFLISASYVSRSW